MTTKQHEQWRQSSLNYLHAVCDAHPELAHCRPSIRKVKRARKEECEAYPLPSNLRQAAALVSRRHMINVEDLLGRSREKRLVEPRKDFVLLCTKMQKTLAEIGRFMGGRDRTSVLHYYQLAQDDAGEKVAA